MLYIYIICIYTYKHIYIYILCMYDKCSLWQALSLNLGETQTILNYYIQRHLFILHCYKNECDQETQKIGIDLVYTCKVCKFKNVALAFSLHLSVLLAAPCHNGRHRVMRQARYGLPSLLATNAIMGPHSHSLV